MPTIADAIDRIEQTLTGERGRADAAFNEGDHPRASNGQFGSGGGGSGSGASKPKPKSSGGFFGGSSQSKMKAALHEEGRREKDVTKAEKVLAEAEAEMKAAPEDKRKQYEPYVARAKSALAESRRLHQEATANFDRLAEESEAKERK